MDDAATFVTELLRDGNSLGAFMFSVVVLGSIWLWRFDKRNSSEHNELAKSMSNSLSELKRELKMELSKEAKGLGRSIDRVEETANRVEAKIDEHIADHARGEF